MNDADSENTVSNFAFSYTSGWIWVFGGKNIATSSLTKLGGGALTFTVYDRDGSGNRYYNVNAYGRTTTTQGTTKTW